MDWNESIAVQPLSQEAFAPYGWVLGKPFPTTQDSVAFINAVTDFRSEHVFDCGSGGQPEILWVSYRNAAATVATLEVHHLTQQAIVPLNGDIVHFVAASTDDGAPDLRTLSAFRVINGAGICMRPGCWHATRVAGGEVACLMLTRRSTTADLVDHLHGKRTAVESAMFDIAPVTFV